MEATMQATYFIDYWLHLKFVAEYFEYLRVDTEGSIQVHWHAWLLMEPPTYAGMIYPAWLIFRHMDVLRLDKCSSVELPWLMCSKRARPSVRRGRTERRVMHLGPPAYMTVSY